MKKILFLIICFVLCITTAFAATLTMPTQPPMEWPPATSTPGAEQESINLKGMTYSELVALKDKINLAIWSSRQWQEVTVPQGVWKVGEDIPAGTWTVRCADLGRDNYMLQECDLSWGEHLAEDGQSIYFAGRFDFATIYNPHNKYYVNGQLTEYTFTVRNGDYIIINDAYNKAVFMPYSGKPSLGFK